VCVCALLVWQGGVRVCVCVCRRGSASVHTCTGPVFAEACTYVLVLPATPKGGSHRCACVGLTCLDAGKCTPRRARTHTQASTRTRAHTVIRVRTPMHTFVSVHTHKQARAHSHPCTHTHAHICKRAHTQASTRTQSSVYAHTCTHL